MTLNPIPLTTDGTGPSGAIPVDIYGLESGPATLDPVLQALVDVGFGLAGQSLTMNSTADGFEWVVAQTGL